MENRGRSQKGRKTQRRAPTGLGFKAMQSFLKNQESVEGFIDELEAGTLDLERFSVGKVERGVGASHFVVIQMLSGAIMESVGIAGFLKGGSAAAGTRIERNSIVILYDSRTGHMNRGRTHTIIGILAPHQADRIFGMMGIRQAGEDDDLFERGGEEEAIHAELAAVRSELAAMRRSVAATASRKSSSSSNAGSISTAASQKSSPSVNIEAEMAAVAAASKSAKKKRQFHTRKERKAAKKAGAGGVTTAWF